MSQVNLNVTLHLTLFHHIFPVGDEVFQYFAPFTFERTANDGIDVTSTKTSNIVALVYEQTGPITVPVETDFCGPQITNRLTVTTF